MVAGPSVISLFSVENVGSIDYYSGLQFLRLNYRSSVGDTVSLQSIDRSVFRL